MDGDPRQVVCRYYDEVFTAHNLAALAQVIAPDFVGHSAGYGDFTIADMDLAAPFGPVAGMNGTIHFTDLLGMETAPGQTLTMESINPGILVENGVVRYQLLPDQLVKVERG